MERVYTKAEDGSLICNIKRTPEEVKERDKEYWEKIAEFILSDDYKKRFIAEYREAFIRLQKLGALIEKYENGSLDFVPKCSIELLKTQWEAMKRYTEILVKRARIEEIELWKE